MERETIPTLGHTGAALGVCNSCDRLESALTSKDSLRFN